MAGTVRMPTPCAASSIYPWKPFDSESGRTAKTLNGGGHGFCQRGRRFRNPLAGP